MIDPYSFHLNGYRYALAPQFTGSLTRWTPYRQNLYTGAIQHIAAACLTESAAYSILVASICE